MGKNKLYSVNIPKPGSKDKLTQPNIPKPKRPVIGITYLQVCNKDYGLKALSDTAKMRSDRNIYNELNEFIATSSKLSSIEKVVEMYHSRQKLKNDDEYSKYIVKLLKENYNVDATDLIHLHCKANGKGEFVLHGFILENVFEIVLIDPLHKIHSS